MVPLLPLRDGVRALPISFFRQSMPSFYMNAPDCICSPGRLPLGAFCAGRDDLEREALHDDRISIRAPRAGRDFLRLQDIARALISIHAPRVGRDSSTRRSRRRASHFNPRAPCGVRPALIFFQMPTSNFNPRTPCGVRQCAKCSRRLAACISIHAPRAGCDLDTEKPLVHVDDFNPRTPCEVRQCAKCSRRLAACISIHAPRAGCDDG